MHYYKFNIGDYSSHAGYLSPLEDIAYRRLLDRYYLDEKPLMLNVSKLARVIGMAEHLEEVDLVLSDFFEKTEDGFRQSRVDKEIKAFHSNADKARANGRKGGRPKKKQTDENQEVSKTEQVKEKTQPVSENNRTGFKNNPDLTQAKPDGKLTTNQEPLTINQETITSSSKTLVPSGDETTPAKPKVNADVMEVFEHWKQVMGKSNAAKLTKERKAKVTARFKDGYTVDQIKQAIEGCAATDHNMGRTPESNGKRFDDLELICRTGSHVERFAGNLCQQQSPMQGLSRITQQNLRNIEGEW